MLSQLDNIIFPDRCEVLEVAPQRFVYPIFKNGWTSLIYSKFDYVPVTEVSNIDTVEIFVREPIQRIFSGLNTWLRYNQHLDKNTLIFLATNNLFINRHYTLQFHWLVNLRRFTKAKIKINPMTELSTVTDLYLNESKQDNVQFDIKNFPKIEFYAQLDKVLTEHLLGKTVDFSEIVDCIKENYPNVYKEVIQRSINLCNVLA
jgi:hypothetical protein